MLPVFYLATQQGSALNPKVVGFKGVEPEAG